MSDSNNTISDNVCQATKFSNVTDLTKNLHILPAFLQTKPTVSTLETALQLSDITVSTFALGTDSKQPNGLLCPNGVLNATRDRPTLYKWFDNTPNNLGIACNNLPGFDLDIAKGKVDADIAFDDAMLLLNEAQELLDNGLCPFQLSWSGNRHLFYLLKPELQECWNASTGLPITDYVNLDIRKGNTYIVGSPSKVIKGEKDLAYKMEYGYYHLVRPFERESISFLPPTFENVIWQTIAKKQAHTTPSQCRSVTRLWK